MERVYEFMCNPDPTPRPSTGASMAEVHNQLADADVRPQGWIRQEPKSDPCKPETRELKPLVGNVP